MLVPFIGFSQRFHTCLSSVPPSHFRNAHESLKNRQTRHRHQESGILNAIGECKKMGLPEPVFEEFAFRFRATISLVPEQEPEFDEVTQKIRAALSTPAGMSSGLSSQQIADEVGLTTRAIRTMAVVNSWFSDTGGNRATTLSGLRSFTNAAIWHSMGRKFCSSKRRRSAAPRKMKPICFQRIT